MSLVACGDTIVEPRACTNEARSSVTLKLNDVFYDQVMADATIVYSVNNGIEKTITCNGNNVDAEDYCGSLVLEYEVAGDFEITVTSPGYEAQTKSVTIEKTKDFCHVIGKALTFNMLRL